MRQVWGIFVVLLFASQLAAQTSSLLPSADAVANTATARTDSWTVFQNPASLDQSGWQAGVMYENRGLIGALSTVAMQAGFGHEVLNVGIGFSYFGYSHYHSMMGAVTLSRRFGGFTLGLQGNILALYAGDEIGYAVTALPQLGATVDVSPKVTLGLQMYNFALQKIRVGEEWRTLPAVYSLGVDYRFHPQIRWTSQVDYDPTTTFRIATGIEYQAIEQLNVGVGAYYYDYVVGCLGMGVSLGDWQLRVDAEWHPILGVNLRGRIQLIMDN